MRYFLLYTLLFVSISACKTDKKSSMDRLFDTVMEEHDAAMELMSDIYQQSKLLTDQKNAAEATDEMNNLGFYIQELHQAEEAMMNWMADFKKPEASTEEAIAQKYLNDQLTDIRKIHVQMKKAIEQSKKYTHQ